MPDETSTPTPYPDELVRWSGHRSGGVRRLFDASSGRPAGQTIRTRLLERLDKWAEDLVRHVSGTPRAVLLVGGPGNGKTEAIEYALHALDRFSGASGTLLAQLGRAFNPPSGEIPRRVQVDVTVADGELALSIVQDASVSDPSIPNSSPALLLVSDLRDYLANEHGRVAYLACINRGVLDDALTVSLEAGEHAVSRLLKSAISAVGLSSEGLSCWPLHAHASIAVWPMDMESLLIGGLGGEADSPARALLDIATDPQKWPQPKTCEAGEFCPFCVSRAMLSRPAASSAFLDTLRQFELATGKRWTFRDLASLISYVLAGGHASRSTAASGSCSWAARLNRLARSGRTAEALRAPYELLSAQYQHAIFGSWEGPGRSLRADLKELRLESDSTLMGLHHFLSRPRSLSIPVTLAEHVASLGHTLDPALASPEQDVQLSAQTTVKYRELDVRFSQSVIDGLRFLRKYHCLSPIEVSLLERLAQADDMLSDPELRRRRPAVAKRVQFIVRDFACRVARRSVGTQCGSTRGLSMLQDFQRTIGGEPRLTHQVVKQFEGLLNEDAQFQVTLNTTFGEPAPVEGRRATLITPRQRVTAFSPPSNGRPQASVQFIKIGSGAFAQTVPLTYELYRSIHELRSGMIPASLPQAVVALLDTTRARLAGSIVRDEDMLDGAEIRLGLKEEVIVRELGEFIVRGRGSA